MKKAFIILMALFLTGCTFYHEEGIDNIKTPEKKFYTMDGQWRLIEKKNSKSESEVFDPIWEKAFFREDIMFLGDLYGEDINYSMKNVDATDYLLYKYRIVPEKLNIVSKNLDIISINDGKEFITEIIKISENKFIFSRDDEFYIYELENSEVSKKDLKIYRENIGLLRSEIHYLGRNGNVGLILGLKETSIEDGKEDFSYRTEYIQISNNEDIKSYKEKDILLPRKNGFYKIKIRKTNIDNDEIRIQYLDQISDEIVIPSDYIKNILYAGNDYLSVENITSKNYKNLRLYPIDYLVENRFVKLGDILDEKSYDRVVMDIKNSKDKDIKNKFKEENFGLRRRNGYWTLFGRVNFKGKERNSYKDFNIRAVTPKTIVNFDDLPILWNEIKSELPTIVDGFISPKKEYLVARMKSEIRVYPIVNNKIQKDYIFSTEIDEDEEIIMAEWATNIYSEMWAEYFLGDKND